jgi:hypothetical protein
VGRVVRRADSHLRPIRSTGPVVHHPGVPPTASLPEITTEVGGPAFTRRVVPVLAGTGAVMLVLGLVLTYLQYLDPVPQAGRTFVQAVTAEGARLFFADAEGNAWSWFSALLLAGVAAALAARAVALRGDRPASVRHGILAGIALLMSADEGAQLHEFLNQIGYRITDRLGPFNAWLIPGVLLVLVLGAVLLWLARGIDAALRRRLVLAGTVFLAGAVGMEAIGTAYALDSDLGNPWRTGRYLLMVAAEEALEMLGALIALAAVLTRIRVRVST